MAKLWNPNWTKKVAPIISIDQVAPIVPQVNNAEAKEVKQDPSMKAILERLERQEAEIKALKAWKNVNQDAKKKYDWPSSYSFSLWTGVPVLSRVSVRKDPSLDREFKNKFGHYESNHYMDLTLSNGKKINVSNYNFLRDRTKTDPMPCSMITTETWENTYVFNTAEYGRVKILSSKFLN